MKLVDAVRDAIFEVILPAYENSTTASVVMSRVWPGQPISESQYGSPWSPTNPGGKQIVTENISKLVDAIPNIAAFYTTSGRGVEDQYGRLLTFARQRPRAGGQSRVTMVDRTQAAAATSAMLRFATEVSNTVTANIQTPDGKPATGIALSQAAQVTNEASVKHANTLAHLFALRAIGERLPPADKLALQNEVTRLEAEAAKPPSDVPAPGVGTSESVAPANRPTRSPTIARDASPSIDSALVEARKKFEISKMASLLDPLGQPYHPSYLTPDDWTSKDASREWPFIRFPITNDGASIALSLRFARVDIIRPWFLMSLFDLPDWDMSAGATPPGSLSTGQAENNAGSFALLPQSMIVTRDILAVDPAGAPLFEAPGLQILAWVNKVMPYSPPALTGAAPGSILVTNRGAFIARFAVAWQQGPSPSTSSSGNFPALAAKSISIPAQAKNISVTVEIMTLPAPFETWKTAATLRFDGPVRKCYEVTGTTVSTGFAEVACAG
jgi:hypothetical protein